MPQTASSPQPELKHILEAILLAAGEPLSVARMVGLFEGKDVPSPADINQALEQLSQDLQNRGIELKEVASGYRLKTRSEMMPWISRLTDERPQRYSRALLETLALIAYRQPITRGEIEEVRGVSVSSNIVRTLQERERIRVVGHRDVPGKPALFGTTRAFLDYFDLTTLDDLPTLAEIRDMTNLDPQFDFDARQAANQTDQGNDAPDDNEDDAEDEQAETVEMTKGSDLPDDGSDIKDWNNESESDINHEKPV